MFLQLIIKGLKNIFGNKCYQSLLTIGAVTLVAFLCGLFMLVLVNFQQLIGSNQNRVQFQVYWNSTLPLSTVYKDWEKIASWPEVTSIETITPEQALNMLVHTFADEDSAALEDKNIVLTDASAALANTKTARETIAYLKENNPLPPTALVEIEFAQVFFQKSDKHQTVDPAKFFLSRLKSLPGISKITFNPLQMDIARTWLKISHIAIWPLVIFLFSLMAMVVGNTLRLFYLSHQEEIEILNLVGASRGYIRLPILITGAAQTLIGGTIALIILKLMQLVINKFLCVPPFWIKISFLTLPYIGLFLVVLILVGLLSGWLAAKSV